jgi:raffinose/stachyose/melibiose transport system substrate-binding protein
MKKMVMSVLLAALAAFSLSAADKVVLTWWTWTLPTQEDFQVLKKGFEAKYPNIELQASVNQMDDYKTKLKVGFASDTAPDVMSMQPGSLLNQFKPYLLDLAPAKATLDKLVPEVVADAKKRSGGDAVRIAPLGSSSTMFVYYNATYFAKAGITKVPSTTAELVDAVAKLKKAYPDKVPFTLGLKDSWFNGDVFAVLANQVEPGLVEKADAGEIKWTDPRFLKALNNLKALVADGLINPNSTGVAVYEDSIGMLMDGKAAMHVNGGWNVGNLSNPKVKDAAGKLYADRRGGRATDGDVFGAFPLPNFNGGKPVVLGGIDIGLSLNKNLAKNPAKLDAALKLLDYMLVGEGRTYQTGRPGSGLIPTLKGASLNTTPFTDKAGLDGVTAIVNATNTLMAGPRGVSNPAVFTQLGVAVQKVVLGSDPAAELAAIQSIYDRQM